MDTDINDLNNHINIYQRCVLILIIINTGLYNVDIIVHLNKNVLIKLVSLDTMKPPWI